MITNQIPSTAGYLTSEERKVLLAKNDWKAMFYVLVHWAWVILSFMLVAYYPNVFTIVIALFTMGGMQLACSVLMHDAGHFSLFSNKTTNDLAGQLLGAWPIFQNMYAYRDYHLIHHKKAGLEEDPDILLTRGYPTSRKSMARKILRDLSGITGIRALSGIIMMHLGYLEYNLAKKVVRISQKERSWKAFFYRALVTLGGPVIVNFIMLAILIMTDNGYLYFLWIAAYLTTFQFSIRIRSIAEHALVDETTNPLKNTRTTYANWLERILFAPYNVNFHLEHHMLMGVPFYNLPKMHKLLKARGFYNEGILAPNYWEIIKQSVSR